MTDSPVLTRPEPGLRCVLAPNPSPMTFHGTNTYIVGEGDVAVIDPGPALPSHRAALASALGKGERITHIFVTHSHLDHSPLARQIAQDTGAPIHAFGRHEDGRSPLMVRLAAEGLIGGGEGADMDFVPDVRLRDADVVEGRGWRIEALHTPGHTSNHMAFAWQDALFTGDHVMGWASSMVSPPDGDLTAFMASCDRLARRRDRIYYPGHGAPVASPADRIAWLMSHRRKREAEILAQLGATTMTVADLTRQIYKDIPTALLPAAGRTVLSHLIDLINRDLVRPDGPLTPSARFRTGKGSVNPSSEM
ncbi:MBL fold metallo-hydrolase [Tropicimonas isoalkanivorans]|uniref:Glyoxylase, beta-lactamase superfamily II n=1 Tax=Tropicimonas isoalkanivorans TaxID=441112 RepID=A0A1I1D706_9RHOB|nr:MBL fold metallo-hydrolase [Tropicimonas isoalkanivorans]SFB70116.1 Glyoxylase, beta-lactamase superfamily II [Tropicimonas isoalkanivorans]